MWWDQRWIRSRQCRTPGGLREGNQTSGMISLSEIITFFIGDKYMANELRQATFMGKTHSSLPPVAMWLSRATRSIKLELEPALGRGKHISQLLYLVRIPTEIDKRSQMKDCLCYTLQVYSRSPGVRRHV